MQETGRDLRVQCAIRLDGPLDQQALDAALQRLIERHEILRTSFHGSGVLGATLQTVATQGRCAVQELDLSGESLSEMAVVEGAWSEALARAFDYEQSPLLHASLVRVAAQEHLLVLGLPGLCADVRTMQNVLEELISGYEAETVGPEQREAAAEVVQYADYAQWQEELREGAEGEEGKQYWKQQSESSEVVRLGVERRGDEEEQSGEVEVWLSRAEQEEVVAVAAAEGVSVSTVLQGAWQGLLWRHSGVEEVAVEVSFDGRKYEYLEKAIGSFAQHLPVTCRFGEKSTVQCHSESL